MLRFEITEVALFRSAQTLRPLTVDSFYNKKPYIIKRLPSMIIDEDLADKLA